MTLFPAPRCVTLAVLAAALLQAPLPASAGPIVNLVQNPGFESGAANWTAPGLSLLTGYLVPVTHSGTGFVTGMCILGCFSVGQGVYLGQSLATTPGDYYDLSFWVQSDSAANTMQVFWNAGKLEAQPVALAKGAWQQYSFTHLLALGSQTGLEVHISAFPYNVALDDFSVTAAAAVTALPAPGSLLLLLTGLGVLSLRAWRRLRCLPGWRLCGPGIAR